MLSPPSAPTRVGSALLLALLVAAPACAALATRKYELRIGANLEAVPNAGDDLVRLRRSVRNIEAGRAEMNEDAALPPETKARLDADYARARALFALRAADKASSPVVALTLASFAWQEPCHPSVAPLIRRAFAKHSDAIVAELQDERLPKNHSYARDREAAPPGPRPRGIVGEVLTAMWLEEQSRVEMNCVFASQRFGQDGVRNEALSFVFSGNGPIYARCYAQYPLAFGPDRFTGERSETVARLIVFGEGWSEDNVLSPDADAAESADYVDYKLEASTLETVGRERKRALFRLFLERTSFFGGGEVEEWRPNGGSMLVDTEPLKDVATLASSTFFWEADGSEGESSGAGP